MNNDLAIRSLLVDKRTGKYIKAVNEHGFDDYVQLFTKSNEKSEIVIFDFSKAVSLFHKPESVRPAPGSTSNPLTCMAI